MRFEILKKIINCNEVFKNDIDLDLDNLEETYVNEMKCVYILQNFLYCLEYRYVDNPEFYDDFVEDFYNIDDAFIQKSIYEFSKMSISKRKITCGVIEQIIGLRII